MTKTDIALIAGTALFVGFLLMPRSKQVEAPAKAAPPVAAADANALRQQANERKLAEAAVLAEKAEAEADCIADTTCWRDRHRDDMRFACGRVIEREAKVTHEWTYNRILDNTDMFRAYSGSAGGPITGEGDQVKMQNKFGVWIPMRYICTYDPESKLARVISISER